jgi:Secretion system C-terminal sorting domain
VKMQKTPKLLLIGLVVLTAASVWATEVKLVTFASGTGRTTSANHRISMTVGQPLAGRIHNSATQKVAVFGFWEMLNQAAEDSLSGVDTPSVQNQLFRNFPNPFNPSTRISFTLVEESQVSLELYDLKGHRVDTLFEGVKSSGTHSIVYQSNSLASGAYVLLMRAGSFRATQRMMLVK